MSDRSSPRRNPVKPEKRASVVAAQNPHPSRRRADALVLAGCLLATLLALWPVCQADFTTWDDPQTVAKNPWLKSPDEAFTYFWAHPNMDLYIPVTYDVWAAVAAGAIQDQPGGPALSPHVFHAANLVVHLVATALVYVLLRRFAGVVPAAAGTLLFGLHPVQVEPVAWVSGMKDVLCGMLMLAALWADPLASLPAASKAGASEAVARKKPARRDKGHGPALARYVAATLLFILALLAKPTAMVLPAVVLVLAWATGRLGRPALLRLSLWFLLAMACAAWTSHFQANPPFVDSPLWLRPIVALHALGFYAVKLLAPIHLTVDYGCSPTWLRQHPAAWAMGLIPITLAAVLLCFRKRAPLLLAAAAIFAIGLAPLLGLVKFDFQFFSTVADHYLYFPMFGAAIALALAVAAAGRRARRVSPPLRAAVAAPLALALVALAVRSWSQAGHWRDTRTLFDHTLEVNPGSLAALTTKVRFALEAHQPQAAEQYARRALAVLGNYPTAIVALGSALAMEGRENEAMEQFRHALQVAPASPEALLNYGKALAARRQFPDAQLELSLAIQQDPENAQAHVQLGHLLLDELRPQEARQELEKAIQLDPQDAEAHAILGLVLVGFRQLDRARDQFTAALELDPHSPPALRGMQILESAAASGQR